jgi:hypothetical protein
MADNILWFISVAKKVNDNCFSRIYANDKVVNAQL